MQMFLAGNAITAAGYDTIRGARHRELRPEGLQLPIDAALRVESRYFTQILPKGRWRRHPQPVPVDAGTEQRAASANAADQGQEARRDRAGFMGASVGCRRAPARRCRSTATRATRARATRNP
jgi:3-hydroxyacyl-CoA dehydrogenase/enoyl-CoA hydratase/3-hydroxybutyryl-CoA epimerase